MPPRASQTRAQLSVLDRLISSSAADLQDPGVTRSRALKELKDSIARDLEWLLNTRRFPEELSEDLEHVNSSVVTYGLPDFTSYTGTAQSRARLERALHRAVELFEPRLLDVAVRSVEDQTDSQRGVVRFLITGMLWIDPAPEQVSYDAQLELSRGEYRVGGS